MTMNVDFVLLFLLDNKGAFFYNWVFCSLAVRQSFSFFWKMLGDSDTQKESGSCSIDRSAVLESAKASTLTVPTYRFDDGLRFRRVMTVLSALLRPLPLPITHSHLLRTYRSPTRPSVIPTGIHGTKNQLSLKSEGEAVSGADRLSFPFV